MQRFAIRSAFALALLASPSIARAHGDAEINVASTADGAGALAAEYEFESVSRLSFSAMLGPVAIYTGEIPAFMPLDTDEPGESLYVLDNGTEVTIEITGIDEGVTSMKIDTTVLAAVGDTAVLGTMPFAHTHPELNLSLTLPEGEFGEGRISFKLKATAGTAYAESPIYTLKLSNGPLPLPDYDTATLDTPAVKCLSAAGKAIRKYVSAKQNLLSKCLDKVEAASAAAALTTPPSNLAQKQAVAEKKCADASGSGPDGSTMLGKIDAARGKAIAAMQDACGTSGSGTLSDDDITQQVGLADCRAEELVASTYGLGHAALDEITVRPSQGGDALTEHLPCLFLTAAD